MDGYAVVRSPSVGPTLTELAALLFALQDKAPAPTYA